MRHVKVAIIGAGSGGLSARREVAKVTDSYVVIDGGPLGTTCARVGCMPSKVLIQVANDFHRRHSFEGTGIHGGEGLSINTAEVMTHVRSLRDRFVRAVIGDMESWRSTHLIEGYASFLGPNLLEVNGETIEADRIIIATGSKPILPAPWAPVRHLLIDTDEFFELETLPESVAVIGLGVIGLELGQALHRLGVKVQAFTLNKALGGLSDPELQDYTYGKITSELPTLLQGVDALREVDGKLEITSGGETFTFDRAFLTMGRRPVLDGFGLEGLDLPRDDRGRITFDSGTYQIGDSPLFLVGDVNGERPLLHEASDEGRIAGYNAVRDELQCFQRRTSLAITFSDPNIATVGRRYSDLMAAKQEFVTGHAMWEGQGRAIVKRKEVGKIHLYADPATGLLLGAELFAPGGEHLAHLLAWGIAAGMTVQQMLSLPFYHPVLEEGLRTALRSAVSKLSIPRGPLEILRCQDPPVGCWS